MVHLHGCGRKNWSPRVYIVLELSIWVTFDAIVLQTSRICARRIGCWWELLHLKHQGRYMSHCSRVLSRLGRQMHDLEGFQDPVSQTEGEPRAVAQHRPSMKIEGFRYNIRWQWVFGGSANRRKVVFAKFFGTQRDEEGAKWPNSFTHIIYFLVLVVLSGLRRGAR